MQSISVCNAIQCANIFCGDWQGPFSIVQILKQNSRNSESMSKKWMFSLIYTLYIFEFHVFRDSLVELPENVKIPSTLLYIL